MLSKLAIDGKELLLKGLKYIRFKKPNKYETRFDKFLTEKLQFIGFDKKAAYAFTVLSILGFAVHQIMYNQENYCRRFAYATQTENKLSKYFTCHFANCHPIIFGLSLPPFLLFARKIELLYGTAFLMKLTFLSACVQIFSLRSTRVYEQWLPKSIKLPIDQTSKDGKYTMGIHGLLATYLTFFVFKKIPVARAFIPVIALADALLSQNGFWGGYLAGYMAFMMF